MRTALPFVFFISGCGLLDGGGGDASEPECSTSDDCGAVEFCDAGSCEQVDGRQFFVQIDKAELSDSYDWDGFGDLPDPFVVIGVDGDAVCATSTVEDDYTVRWEEGCDVVFGSGELQIELYDEDISSNDLGLTFAASGLDDLVQLVRDESSTLSNDYASVDISIFPDF
jgi:hypothetical protein